jgi:hypothetical protein
MAALNAPDLDGARTAPYSPRHDQRPHHSHGPSSPHVRGMGGCRRLEIIALAAGYGPAAILLRQAQVRSGGSSVKQELDMTTSSTYFSLPPARCNQAAKRPQHMPRFMRHQSQAFADGMNRLERSVP